MAEGQKIQVLIVTGQLSVEHDPETSQLLRRMLESTGRFSARVTEEFRGASTETLADYGLVILNYDGGFPGRVPVPLGTSAEQALLDFVRAGKGMIFHHSAVWVSPWPEEFLPMMGGFLDPALGSRKNPIGDFTVKTSTGVHPVTTGLVAQWNTVMDDFFAGVVWHPEARCQVLATVFDDVEGYRHMPPHIAHLIPAAGPETMRGVNEDGAVAWVNHYGAGRVFAISIGHGVDTIRRPDFVALYCRAAEWAATGEVTLAPPDRSGENRRRPWPYYAEQA